MPVIHLFTVRPVHVQPHELPRVQYGDYYIHAADVQAAWARVAGTISVAGDLVDEAAEVWAFELGDDWIVTPDTHLNKQEGRQQHDHWAAVQDRYTLVHRGPESLSQWSARTFDEYLANRAVSAAA